MILLSALCLLTVTVKAQTITAESVLKGYFATVNNPNSEYAYNADISDGVLTAQYVYRKVSIGRGRKTVVELHPYLMYRYAYDEKFRLSSRVAFFWNDFKGQWQNSYRLDYTYEPGRNVVECCRWNEVAQCFGRADEKMIYALHPNAAEGLVSSFRRGKSQDSFEQISQLTVPAAMFYGDELLTLQTK